MTRDSDAPTTVRRAERWPIIIDAAVEDRLVDAVTNPSARLQLIRGADGVGKTALAARVAVRLRALGFTVTPIVAVPELQAVPMAAFAPLLAAAGAPEKLSLTERLNRALHLITSGAATPVLLIDDALLLDEVSAGAVYQLVRVYGIRCIATARSGHRLTGPLERLRRDGLIDETVLAPVTPEVALDILERVLGGAVDPHGAAAIIDAAAGVPLYLRLLLDDALEASPLSSGPDGIVLPQRTNDGSIELPSMLRDSFEARFAVLSERELSVIRMLAVAAPLAAKVIDAPAEIDTLERVGLAVRDSGSLRLAHPLLVTAAVGTLSAAQRLGARDEACALLRRRGLASDRFAAIGLEVASVPDGGPEPSAADSSWAAGYANRAGLHLEAIELATRSCAAGGGIPPLLIRAASLAAIGRHDEADLAFDSAKADAATEQERMLVASREGTHLATLRQRLDLAVDLASAALDSGPDTASSGYLASDRATWLLMTGEADSVESVAHHENSADPATALNATLHTMIASVYAADLTGTRAAVLRAEALLARTEGVPHAVHAVAFARFLVIAFEGRPEDARRYAAGWESGPESAFLGMWDFGLALVATHRGALTEAGDFAARGMERLARSDFSGTLGVTTALRASIAAQAGRFELARSILEGIPAHARDFVKEALVEAEAEAFLMAAGARAGSARGAESASPAAAAARRDAAVEIIAAAVGHAIRTRYFAYGALTAHYAVRLGRPDAVLDHLREIGGHAEGALIAAVVAHAEALHAGDPDALIAVAERLGRVGLLAGAVDAARQASDRASGARRGATLRAAEEIVLRWSARGRGPATSASPPSPTTPEALSEREHTVARAAAARERSRDIASRLGLSVRTVDNHLLSVYRKLGISRRTELAAALDRARA